MVKGFGKFKKFQKSKNNLEVGGWVGPGPIWVKQNGKIVQK